MNDFLLGSIFSDTGFLYVSAILWLLIMASILLLLWGIWKKTWQGYFFSGLTFLTPAIILSTQKGLFSLFLFLPLLAFFIAYLLKKRMD
jgi:hypothetical protein